MMSMRRRLKTHAVCSSSRWFSQHVLAVAREAEVMRKLFVVNEPITGRRLVSLGCVKAIEVKESTVRVDLDLVVPGYGHTKAVQSDCLAALKSLSWVSDVSFTVAKPRMPSYSDPTKAALRSVKHIIGVSSCKGGVGKSTVAVNLACTMAKQGLSVGLLDADIYGPSLPFQLQPESPDVLRSPSNPQQILPLTAKDLPTLKILSFGHVNPKSGAPGAGGQTAALVRGPIATKIINQLLLCTEWGELDYLIVDMPPGTGDIQITLSQLAAFSGAVLVTTPHRLALVDVVKGMALFQSVDIRTLAIVENMSFFQCEHGQTYYPFGKGGKGKLLDALRTLHEGAGKKASLGAMEETIKSSPFFSLPLLPPADEALAVDAVEPPAALGTSVPPSPAQLTYQTLAQTVVDQIFAALADIDSIPSAAWDATRNSLRLRYFTPSQAFEFYIPQDVLAVADAQSGLIPAEVPKGAGDNVLQIEAKGRYGLAIVWRHQTKIFPFDVLRRIAEDLKTAS